MNEQKRRGRRSNAEKAALEEEALRAGVAEGLAVLGAEADRKLADLGAHLSTQKAQAYALRIWHGQSPDLSRHERLGRIAAALEAQGMSMEGVVL